MPNPYTLPSDALTKNRIKSEKTVRNPAEGEGETETELEGLMDADKLADAEGDLDAEGLREAEGEIRIDGETDAEGETDGEILGDKEADGEREDDGDGLAEADCKTVPKSFNAWLQESESTVLRISKWLPNLNEPRTPRFS